MAIPSLSKKVSLLTGFVDLEDTAPPAPAANRTRLFRRSLAGRQMPAWIGPTGLETTVQGSLFRNKIGLWQPPGDATTVPGVFGMAALSVQGTATARNVATTNALTRMRRLGYVSAATAAAFGAARLAVAQVTLGDGAGLGGLFSVIRFAFTDPVLVTDARSFVGARNSVAAATNVEPSTLTNGIGVGHGAADANLKLFYGGSTAQTPIDLGATFSKALNIPYELILFASPNTANSIGWQVTRLDTGDTASGTVTGAAAVIPQSSMLMTPFSLMRTNNATAASVALDIISLGFETDN